MEPLTADERARLGAMLPSLMLFSVVWSLGASCDKPGRALFDAWLRERVVATQVRAPCHTHGTDPLATIWVAASHDISDT